MTIFGAGNLSIGTVISGAGGLTMNGNGTLTLSGANSFTGQLSVQAGTLSIATINNISTAGTLGNSALSVSLGNTGVPGTLEYTGATASSTKTFTMATGGTGAFQIDTAGTTLTLSGVINGSGGLLKTGAGTLLLSAANSYSGGTTLTAGTLQLSGSGTLGSTTASLTVNGGTLNLGGTSQTVGALNGCGGTINTSTGATTLTVGNGGGSGLYGGTLANGVGSVALTKIGAGTQGLSTTLSGSNTYTGATSLNGGVLRLDSVGVLSVNSNLQFRSGVLGLGTENFTLAAGTGAGQVQWTNSNGGGFAAYGADRIVNIGGAGATLATGSSPLFWQSSSDNLILGAADADHTVTFVNPIQLDNSGTSTRTVRLTTGPLRLMPSSVV